MESSLQLWFRCCYYKTASGNTRTAQNKIMSKRSFHSSQLDLLAFFGIAFFISWGVWFIQEINGNSNQWLLWIAGFGPTLSALALTVLQDGWSGLRQLFNLPGSAKPRWYIISLLSTPLAMLVSLGLHIALGGALPHFVDPNHLVISLDQWPLVIVVFLYIFIFTAIGEEIGWRGYALPRLQARFSPFVASIIIGLIWAVWHLPLFWMAGNFHQQLPLSWFLLQILGSTFIYTWMFNRTGGSLLIALLFHTSSNAAVGLLPILPLDNNGSLRPLWLVVVLLWLIVGFVLWFDRDKFFT